MGASNEELLKYIKYYQDSLDRYTSKKNYTKLLYVIEKLKKLSITTSHLEETGIGRSVNALRKLGGDVGEAAKGLVAVWKDMVFQEENRAKEEAHDDSGNTTYSSENELDSTEIQSRSSLERDLCEKESSSSQHSNDTDRKISDTNKQNMYKHSSSSTTYSNNDSKMQSNKYIDKESYSEKQKNDSDSNNKGYHYEKQYKKDRHKDNSSKKHKQNSRYIEQESFSEKQVHNSHSNNDVGQGKEYKKDKCKDSSSKKITSDGNCYNKEQRYKAMKQDKYKDSSSEKHKQDSDSNNEEEGYYQNDKSDNYQCKISPSKKRKHRNNSSSDEHDSKSNKKSSKYSVSDSNDEVESELDSEEENIQTYETNHSKSKKRYKSESSADEVDIVQKSKKLKHISENEDSGEKYEKFKNEPTSSTCSKNRESVKSQSKIERKKYEYNSSSDQEEKPKSGSKSKKDLDCEENKSTSKRKLSSSDAEEYKSKSKAESKSRHERKSKSHSDKHEKRDKKESRKEESHSRKEESRNHEKKSKRSKEYYEKNKKEKSSSKTETSDKTKQKSTSSEKSGVKNKEKKLAKPVSTEKIINGIDSGSGASFAEALGMCGPSVSKSSSSGIKKKSSSSSSLDKPKVNASSVKPEKYEEVEDNVPILLKEPQLVEPLNLNMSTLLPEITPNYRPLGFPLDTQPKRILTDDEALSRVISNKNQRTKVYSGNKSHGKVDSLFDICVRILQENIDALEYTGGVPYLILKPVLEKANPDQLFNMEHHNPYLIEDTDELWQLHCQKEFRNKQQQEMESWREMYMRCLDEREIRLNAITANIKQAQDRSTPIRTTKLAYVDSNSIVKPPRNILRKQAKNGTVFDKKPAQTPASRVAALAGGEKVGKISVPNPGSKAAERPSKSSSSAALKPKKAPLMAKTLSFLKNRFKR